MTERNEIYIDGTGLVLGRLSSWLAKKLLAGNKITVVNAQDLIVSGRKKFLIDSHLQKRARATHTNPNRGPFYPRYPDRILRRTVRGMLPWTTSSGKQAYRKLSAYIDIPDEIADNEFISIPEAKRSLSNRYMTVGELSKSIGWVPKVNN
ncbi:MAG: 50S ribosomal protein L13 [Candidatus Kariarchaeaceae archaeon]|jgi:large subunit ribosomal protein L13